MKAIPLAIAGAALVHTDARTDQRGAFTRLFCVEALAEFFGGRRVVQANHSRTNSAGALRGLHFQHAPHAEMKLVRCLRGRVWDVVVDLRAGSPTFLHWHAEELSADNARMMLIPEGCAHGFQALEADSELLYLHTAPFTPQAEGGVRHDDPAIGIRWPLPVTELSARDRSHPLLSAGFAGLQP
ncbi:dTDP-4-dehydrorhamnose 3,5-epimerase family protein [Cupriavidus nantongensis]|uniref:dTDP-4-dehydrorhamnose 3,5-epimerase n=1 Tax=Cupriavidus nantongensis TaxID=1796606 RepID=A0A142JV50_9BURK|nr:dTDP-4-dehydrorhamnose 3,5-epimerase family protein [Cupriavidus nantongensis]AMR81962.1 dTDP-4-dehydrorhamnose 3,5-epimerase [Cupriavidus nantongensis]